MLEEGIDPVIILMYGRMIKLKSNSSKYVWKRKNKRIKKSLMKMLWLKIQVFVG